MKLAGVEKSIENFRRLNAHEYSGDIIDFGVSVWVRVSSVSEASGT